MVTAAPKPKKASPPKKPRSHPPYVEMISEAIGSLKERTGSSQYAIAKFIEEKQKDLPPNFKKLLLVQLKKLVAAGKLVKVKNSFKLSPAAAKPAAPTAAVKKPAVKKAPGKKKSVAVKKTKATGATPVKKAVVKKAKVAKRTVRGTPAKKSGALKVKKTPMKAKKPKSIKSPAKKVTGKKK